jgi:hypothetical protein
MLASRIVRWNGFVMGGCTRSPNGAQRNPGAVRAVRDPDFAEPVIGRRFAPTRWLHPGYKLDQCASAVVIDNCTGSSTYFITADR